jgi:predicted nucleotide-binding protein
MPAYPIEIVQLGAQTCNDIIEEVLDKLNELQDDFLYTLPTERNKLWGLPIALDLYTTDYIWEKLAAYREDCKGFHPFIIGVINGHLSSASLSNRFGDNDSKAGLATITTYDWDAYFAPPPLKVYLMYYFIRYTMSFVCSELHSHKGRPECFFHMKIEKARIKDSMITGKLCDSCSTILGKNIDGHTYQSLTRLISHLQAVALGVPPVATKPKVFVGSSTDGLPVAEALRSGLVGEADCVIWNQGPFGLSYGNLENLVSATQEFKYAILVLTPDDVVIKQGIQGNRPRDNVLFELGLFMGALGRNRTFMVSCADDALDIPSDLAGVSQVHFKRGEGVSLQEAIAPACKKIIQAIGL